MWQLLRNRVKPRTLLFLGLTILALLVMGVSSVLVHRRTQSVFWEAASADASAGDIPAHENALMGGMRHNRNTMIQHEQALAALRQAVEQVRAENEQLKTQLIEAKHEQALASQNGSASGLSADETKRLIDEQLRFVQAALAVQQPSPSTPVAPPAPPLQHLQGAKEPPAPYQPPEPVRDWVRIPDRSTATAVTISGSAGQANGEPFPVNVQIESDLTGPGPAHVRIPLKGCRVGADGVVQAVAARSRYQIKSLSCTFTLADGRIQPVEVSVRGWLTGPDNINGGLAEIFHNEADIYRRFGQAAIPVALVSLLNETRQVVHQVSPLTGVVTTVGNDVAQEIAKEIAGFYVDKAREYFDPLAWVPDNQRVYVHFDGGVTLPIERQDIVRGRSYAASTSTYSSYR